MDVIKKSAAEMLRQIADDFAAMNAKYAPIIQQLERNLTATEQQATPRNTKLVMPPQNASLAIMSLQDVFDEGREDYCNGLSGRLT